MNVSLKNNDAVSALLKVEIEKNDYADQLDKSLRKLRQKAQLPGFRQGMVPLSIIKKLYGKQAILEEVNKLVTNGVQSYLKENEVKVLGEVIPNETKQKKLDFDVDENFEFCFDIALMPEINVQLTKDDTLPSYRIVVEDEIIDQQIDSYRRQYGSQEQADKVAVDDLVRGIMVELENGEPKEAGIKIESATLIPSYMKGKMEQKKFIGLNVGTMAFFNPYKAYKGAEAELASLLNIDKDAVKKMKNDFSFEITEITRYQTAELDRELFDKIFEKDSVKNETEFRERIKGLILSQYLSMVDTVFKRNMHDMLIRKMDDISFADDILKRWMLLSNEKLTKETVENDYPAFVKDMKYNFVKNKLAKDYNITVENEDVEAMAVQFVRSLYAQYGVYTVPDDELNDYVTNMLNDEKKVNDLESRVLDEKLSVLMKERITIDEQAVTTGEFEKIVDDIR